MAKDWTPFMSFKVEKTESDREVIEREQRSRNIIKNTNKLKAAELFEENEKAYRKKQEYNAQLINAYNSGRLKSERLKKEAESLIAKKKKKTVNKTNETVTEA